MVTVYFATNRDFNENPEDPDFGTGFNAHGPHAVRFGRAEVTGRKLDKFDITIAPEVLKEGTSEQVLGSREIFGLLKHKMRKHARDTLVYIHGFDFTFKEALSRGAELKQTFSAGGPINVFVFTWPGDGEMVPLQSYYSDRSDARNSGMAMARTFLFLRDFLVDLSREDEAFCQQRMHILAHSMGNYALRFGVQGIRAELGSSLPRLFDNVILAAADEDDDAFEQDDKLRQLPALTRRLHIYHSRDDRALLISDTTKRNPDRLGSEGPRLIDDLPRKVILLDCRDVDEVKGDITNHQYYRSRKEVIEDIKQVLAGKAPEEIPNRVYDPGSRSFRIKSKKPKARSRRARDDDADSRGR